LKSKKQMAVQYAFGKIITQGLDLNVDAADPTSYPGSGTSWTSVVNRSITGSLVSCSFSSDFKGGIVLSNQSSSIQFSGSVANFGSGSFSVDITVRPSQIQGIHWLFSKNSGSFPNWGAYISGSGGSGKAFLVCNISSTVSASFSSSGTLTTGSTYVSSFRFSPFLVSSYGTPVAGTFMTFNNGATPGGLIQSNGSGSLATTASLFIGNTNTQNLAFSGSIYNIRIYQGPSNFSQIGLNYSTQCTRFGLPQQSPATRFIRTLVVGGGGGGGIYISYGGGGGGAVIEAFTTVNTGRNRVIIAPGQSVGDGIFPTGSQYLFNTSSFSDIIAIGGGNGASLGVTPVSTTGSQGASGGGGNPGGLAVTFNGTTYGFAGANSAGGGAGGLATGLIPGPGKPSDITGTTTYYGGGGAGGSSTIPVSGGIGGGGGNIAYKVLIGLPTGSGFKTGMPGSANTGGGGGGVGEDARNNQSTTVGGSGIVIMRYQGAQQALGGQITTVGGDTVHTFTASADFILL
jgi:hypothetical protein